jgi:hypothetical protein
MIDKESMPELWAFLVRCGFKAEEIAGMTLETRLLHDLGLDGDNFFDTVATLQHEFGVDLSGLKWSRYAPTEGEKLFPLSVIKSIRNLVGRPQEYDPLTLGMIAEALRQKKWPYG